MLGEHALWLLIASVLIFFYRPLLGETFFFRDLYLLFLGKKLLLVEALRHGQLPLWDPLMHGGQPFLASPNNSVLYPFNILFAVMPAIAALNLHLVLQFVFCAVSSYFLARAIGLSTTAAFVAGTVYTFCGYVLSSANLLVLMQAVPWAPALLGAVHLLLRERRKRWLVAAAVFGALPLLAGGAEMSAMSFALAIAWALTVPRDVPVVRRFVIAALVVVFSAGLSLVQTLPAYEMIRNSSRQERRDYAAFAQWSVSPQRLPELVVPRFFGPTDTLAQKDYWGGRFEAGYPYIVSIYFGASALLLALGGLLASETIPRRGRILLGLFAAAGFILALGHYLPFFHFLWANVPLVGNFRFPVKALQLGLVPIALLSGAGADAVVASTRRILVPAVVSAAIFAIIALAFIASPAFRGNLTLAFFDGGLSPSSSAELTRSLVHAAIAAAMFVAILLTKREPAIALLVLFDLAWAGHRVNPYASRELFVAPPLAEKVRTLLAGGGRLYRTPDPWVQRLNVPANENVWLAWWDIQLLSRYTAATFGIPLIFHEDYDGLAPIRMSHMTDAIARMPWANRLNILSAAGATAIVTPDVINAPGVDRIDTLRGADGRPLYLYRNRASKPVRFATNAVVIADDAAALRRLATTPFDPKNVILSEPPVISEPHVIPSAARNPEAGRHDPRAIEIDAPSDGFLVFAETWYPGWRMVVDGRETPQLRADVAFAAAAVPAGHHIVTKTYRPLMPLAGLIGTLTTALLLAFWRLSQ